MLQVSGLTISLGGRTVLRDVSFVANADERIGIVGPNGAGKTTLLRVIAGQLVPDRGSVALPTGSTVGFLHQGYADDPAATAGALFPRAFGGAATGSRLAELAAAIAEEHDADRLAALTADYDREVVALADAATAPPFTPPDIPPSTPIASLSGGEVTRLALAHITAARPDPLLLDEPTNHLDIGGIEEVEAHLRGFRGPVLIVSHDRAFLDAVATHILAIDPLEHTAELFTGDYTAFANEQARRIEEQWEAYRRQQREERKLKEHISAIESRARGIENRTIDFHYRKRAKKVARRSTTLKARLERQMENEAHVDRPDKRPGGFYGEFTSDRSATLLVSARDVSIEAGGKRLIQGADFTIRRGERVALVGPNGSGKTTLLRAILGRHPVASGELQVAPSAKVGYLSQEDANDFTGALELDPVEFLRRRVPMSRVEIGNFLHRFLFGHDLLATPIGRLSFGERRRLSLAQLVLTETSLLLLDEPTNHLDLPSREAFEEALEGYGGATIAVSHDRYFLERFADRTLAIDGCRFVEV
jgi:ATP-binding cassette subfamily F protein 3